MEAILALEDGRVFRGRSLGAPGETLGEVVFNTGLTGYQEILTDPSYRGQIVTLTVPHVGNTGVNEEDPESWRPHASGLIVRDASSLASSWRARNDLAQYMKMNDIVGLEGTDTRALTRHLRSGGVLRGCLSTEIDKVDQLVARAKEAPRLEEQDLVGEVTRREAERWHEGRTGLLGSDPLPGPGQGFRVAALDYGVKRNILRMLASTGVELHVLPARSSAEDVLALAPDGVFLSNGPGDPATCTALVQTIRELIGRVPIFGICLGHQLTALALGARTYKLKFGHRGTNHPVREIETGRVSITSQNHGFSVDPDSLGAGVRVTHESLYDGTVEGLEHTDHPLFTVQFHPEAAPGPHDTWGLFGRFIELMDAERSDEKRGAKSA